MADERDERPRPQYGEYAPLSEQGEAEAGTGTSGRAGQAPSPSGSWSEARDWASSDSRNTPTAGQIPGVPHNLGAGTNPRQQPAQQFVPPSQPGQPGQPSQPQGGSQPQGQQHYRATEPPAGSGQPGTGKRTGGRLADLIVTVILLVAGAWGAMSQAFTLLNIPADFALWGRVLGIEGFAVPSSVGTTGTVGAIILLSLYAVTLILSIQLLRRRRLAFYVPLIAGVVAFIIAIAIMTIAISSVPELLQQMSDPGSAQKIIDYYLSASAGSR